MSGSQRVFVRKLQRAGFADIWVGDTIQFGLAEAALYPLFTPERIAQMREQLPAERHENVATSVLVTARKPSHGAESAS